MVDYITIREMNTPIDDVTVVKLCPPITGKQQAYRLRAASYTDKKEIDFVLSRDELLELRQKIEEALE